MRDGFSEIVDDLRDRGISTYRQRRRQLVVSRQRGPALPDAGNSFWVCKLGDDWYVCTWAPFYYRVPAGLSLIDVCEAFVEVGTSAQTRIPPTLVTRFGLMEIDDGEFNRRWKTRAKG